MNTTNNKMLTTRALWLAVGITFIIKLYLIYALPMTADEAYEIWVWGQHLAGSYYDHPLMNGWYGHFMLEFFNNRVWLRLPQISSTSLISFVIYGLFYKRDQQKALLAAILFAVSPVNLLFVLILSDSLLLFFTIAAMALLILGIEKNKYWFFALSGLMLACGFWSKYLVFPTALGIFIFFLFSPKLSNRYLKGFIVFAIFAIAVAQNLWWNYTHAWTNILFNLFNRNSGAHFNIKDIFSYIGCVILLFSPMLFWQIIKNGRTILGFAKGELMPRLLFWAGAFPLLFYLLLSLKKQIGIHWFFSNYTIMFMVFILILSVEQFKKQIKYLAIYTGVLVIICIVILNLPVSIFKKSHKYDKLNYELNMVKIIPRFKSVENKFIIMTPSYAASAMYSMYLDKYTPIWGHGGVHSRQDDIVTNFKDFAGKNILISLGCFPTPPSKTQYLPYFNKVELVQYQYQGSSCYYVKGYGFKFKPYRVTVLQNIFNEYYQRPKFLPKGKDFFADKYGFIDH